MKVTFEGKKINLSGYSDALATIARDAAEGLLQVCVYLNLDAMAIETRSVAYGNHFDCPYAALVGYYERPIRRGKLSWDIRSALANLEFSRKRDRQYLKFYEFENASSGYFDGYPMNIPFRENYMVHHAIWAGYSDDSGDAETPYGTFHVGADGVKVFLMSEQPTKTVSFNRYAYLI